MTGRRDKEEFELLVRPHLASLYRTALRMVHHRDVAEDMVQETCLKAFAAFRRGPQKANFRAWLFRILVNLCIDHIRAAGRQSAFLADALSLEAIPTKETADPETHSLTRGLGDQIRAAIAALEPELRLVVLLVLVEELSYAEAAESLDVPVGTVRSRLNRARGQLQSLLREPGPRKQGPLRMVADSGVAVR